LGKDYDWKKISPLIDIKGISKKQKEFVRGLRAWIVSFSDILSKIELTDDEVAIFEYIKIQFP
jgi:hypothetical protein